ncbi:MFS general substrate transporter [Glarea lozoyensis ATCC 20868]|uniref:MFS general substrate transporter n=1 Tax=Glarea lozoyensis (strain ATCC 20868 / MF5171) TaxID=1116229 RepID=S3CRB6_GLAL2|nr:MFS general substrate transporter [Glarea lozoyensis ATCC 20868]EPE29007.1 MFS general substrate transporter [Glarea lozoyensis ATCC 20868]
MATTSNPPPATTATERTSLLENTQRDDDESTLGETPDTSDPPRAPTSFGVLAVLLIGGAFISNSDGSLVLATYGNISSHFNDFESGRWLLTSAMLASCAAQPIYGKLSNIYGRKVILLLNYVLFGLGSAISGSGQSMGQIIFGRVVGGTGAAGMVSMVSILISDLVPMKEVATYRSYVNVISTTGRSIGGPLGGYIAQNFGWRWSFYFQCPIALLAFVLVAWQLKLPKTNTHVKQSHWEKFSRIDFLGSLFLSLSIVLILLSLDLFAKAKYLSDAVPIASISIGLASLITFCLIEKYQASEPIFPLKLLVQRDVVSCYAILALQSGAQLTLMSTIPLYFQITLRATPGKAGLYLISAVLGNTFGGILTGIYIKRSAKYLLPTILSGVFGCITYTLLIIRWNGHTSFPESLYVFGGGLALGTSYSALFIAVAACVSEEEFAIAGSGLYMFSSIGTVAGISISGALFKWGAGKGVNFHLKGVKNGLQIANRALEDIEYINTLSEKIHRLVVSGYLSGFKAAFAFSLASAAISLIIAVTEVKEGDAASTTSLIEA